MPKRRENKELLISIISLIIALIVMIVGCSILKNNLNYLEDTVMSIVFAITLFIVCIAYVWILFTSVCLIDILCNIKKKR